MWCQCSACRILWHSFISVVWSDQHIDMHCSYNSHHLKWHMVKLMLAELCEINFLLCWVSRPAMILLELQSNRTRNVAHTTEPYSYNIQVCIWQKLLFTNGQIIVMVFKLISIRVGYRVVNLWYTPNSNSCVTISDNNFHVQWNFPVVKGRVVQWTRIAKEVGWLVGWLVETRPQLAEGRETYCGRIWITKVVFKENYLYIWSDMISLQGGIAGF